jgi:hypothetical protein
MPIGNSIPRTLVDALKLREEKISSDVKTPDTLSFTHARSSFAVVRSLVKVDNTFELSKKAALTAGIGLTSRSGIDREADKNLDNSEAAYYQTEVFGFRPMPGITNINSQVIGGHGAIRKTTVGFKANSVEDLDLLNRVYMHFGATVLVEFGHTTYVSKDGTVKQMGLGDIMNEKELYVEGIGLNTIRKKIADITDEKNYSYEGIVGYVSNFSFNFNIDGSYDCTIQITSHNGVTDSLSIPNVNNNVSNFKIAKKEGEPEGDVTKGLNNIVDLICTGIERYNGTQGKINLRTLFDSPNVNLSNIAGKWVSNYDAHVSLLQVQGAITEAQAAQGLDKVENQFVAFLPLKFWLALFNVYAMPRTKDSTLVRWSMNSNSWRGYKFMYSHNPGMVQLSRKASGETKGFNVSTKENPNFPGDPRRGQDLINVNEKGNRNILDINVSTALIKRVNSNFIANNPKKADEIGMTDWVDLLLDEIQKYMGNINSFEIATSPRPNGDYFDELEIYDKSGIGQKNAEVLNLSGLSTTVTNVSINSDISNNIQVAAMLGGAGKKGSGGKTQAGIEYYNTLGKDAHDALIGSAYLNEVELTKEINDEKDTEAESLQGNADIKTIIQELYDAWNAGEGNEFEKILDSSQKYAQSLIGGKSLGRYIPIPVSIDFELMGMGGWKNLECFSIPEHLLPTRFGNTKFIIFGVEHSLDSSDSMWKTSITGKLKPN